MTTTRTDSVNDIRDSIREFLPQYHALLGSDNNLATVVHTNPSHNVRACKCAFCKSDLAVGEGWGYNGWRGQRYLCETDFANLVSDTAQRVREDEAYRREIRDRKVRLVGVEFVASDGS